MLYFVLQLLYWLFTSAIPFLIYRILSIAGSFSHYPIHVLWIQYAFFFFKRHLVFLSLSVSFGFLPSLLIGPLFLICRLSLTVIDEWWILAAGLHCRLTKSLAKLFTKGLLSAFEGKKLVKLSLAVTQKTENVLIHSWHQVRLWSRILKE